MRITTRIILIMLLIIPAIIIQSQDTLEVDYNFCNDADVWGGGHCENQDPNIEACMWEVGWYLARVANGEISLDDIKSNCLSVVNITSDSNTVTITSSSGGGGGGVTITIVIVLAGASGTDIHPSAPASPDETLNQDNFDVATDGAGLGIAITDNVTIYGNSANNTITGGDGDDTIYGDEGNDNLNGGDGDDTIYGDAGNDNINGGDDDDTIYGGDESCGTAGCNTFGTLGDTINGGNGNDTINGGTESCDGGQCNLLGNMGDTINGGDGNDTINGGTESCNGNECNDNGSLGDTINGGSGNDVINGDTEFCTGSSCNFEGEIGDTLNGGDGSDSLNGGNESCTGSTCNETSDRLGDIINQNDAGNTDDVAVDTINGGTETAGAGSGSEGDTCQANTGDIVSSC